MSDLDVYKRQVVPDMNTAVYAQATGETGYRINARYQKQTTISSTNDVFYETQIKKPYSSTGALSLIHISSICLGIFLLAGYSKGRQAAVLIPYLLFAGIFYGRIRDGFLILSNDMLHFMTEKTGKIYLEFQVNAEGNVYFTLFSIGFLAAFLTANAIWYGTLWPVSPVIFLVAAALISGFSREVIAAAVFLAGVLLLPDVYKRQAGSRPTGSRQARS